MNKVLAIACIFLSGILLGQETDALLGKVKAHYASIKGFSANFTQTLIDASGEQISFNGTLKISGDKFNISLSEQNLISDGATLWVYFSDVNEVIISSVENDGSELMRPSYYFSIPTEQFLFKEEGKETVNGKTMVKYRFTPKDKNMNFHTLYLWINPATNEIQKAEIIDKEQQHLIFSITEQVAKDFGAGTFGFDAGKHAGVVVTDNR